MSKKQKKRNKPYTGENAASKPVVRRYQAVVRSPQGEWWHDHKKQIKIGAIVICGGAAFIYLIYEFLRLVF